MSRPRKLFAFDCETSDVSTEAGQILSCTIVAVDARTGAKLETMSLRLGYRGDVVPSPEAIAVNGINLFKEAGLREVVAAKRIVDFTARHGGADVPFLGHNISFDLKHLKSLLRRNGFNQKSISQKRVDTYVEAVRLIIEGKLPLSGLAEVTSSTGKTRRSLTQESLAGACKIDVDKKKLHGDAYDVDVNLKIWEALGRPVGAEHDYNNPYELERLYAGKTVSVTAWDPFNCEAVRKRFYVVGKGTGREATPYGEIDHHGTVLIRLDGEDATGALRVLSEAGSVLSSLVSTSEEREKAKKIYKAAVAKVTVERKFSSSEWYQLSEETRESSQITSEVISSATECVRRRRLEDVTNEYQTHALLASGRSFNLRNPEDTTGALHFSDQALIPNLVREMTNMTSKEREAAVSSLANSMTPPRGVVWSYNMLVMSERYGIRNQIKGYEDCRRVELMNLVPAEAKLVTLSKSLDEVDNVVRKAMTKKRATRIDFICNGKDVRLKLFGENDAELARRRLDIQLKKSGDLLYPLAPDIAEAVVEMLDVSASSAIKLRTGFSAYVDKYSYEALKRRFQKVLADVESAENSLEKIAALKECLAWFGNSYTEFLENAVPLLQDDMPEDLNAYDALLFKVKQQEGLKDQEIRLVEAGVEDEAGVLSIQLEERKKKMSQEIANGYENLPGVILPKDADSKLILALNFKNPAIAATKNLDHLAIAAGVYPNITEIKAAFLTESDVASNKDLGDDDHLSDGDDEEGATRCKVCNRIVSSRNAVAGMGPSCAKKLQEWLKHPDAAVSEITKGKFKRLSDLKDDGNYPIMIVRDIRTGRTFASDIKRKEKDGRYLAVDLSEVIKKATTEVASSKLLLRDTLKVYLDDENYEVARIFGSPEKYYKT